MGLHIAVERALVKTKGILLYENVHIIQRYNWINVDIQQRTFQCSPYTTTLQFRLVLVVHDSAEFAYFGSQHSWYMMKW